jgi:hypothetical protein
MLADGCLRINPAAWQAVSDEVVIEIIVRYFQGDRGPKSVPNRDRLPESAELGRFLMATYEIGNAVFHILTDHGNTIMEIVLGEK